MCDREIRQNHFGPDTPRACQQMGSIFGWVRIEHGIVPSPDRWTVVRPKLMSRDDIAERWTVPNYVVPRQRSPNAGRSIRQMNVGDHPGSVRKRLHCSRSFVRMIRDHMRTHKLRCCKDHMFGFDCFRFVKVESKPTASQGFEAAGSPADIRTTGDRR